MNRINKSKPIFPMSSTRLVQNLSSQQLRDLLLSNVGYLLAPKSFRKAYRSALKIEKSVLKMSVVLRSFLTFHRAEVLSYSDVLRNQMRSKNGEVRRHSLMSLSLLGNVTTWQLKLIFKNLNARNPYQQLDASFCLQEVFSKQRRLSKSSRSYLMSNRVRKTLMRLTKNASAGPNILLALDYLRNKHNLNLKMLGHRREERKQ